MFICFNLHCSLSKLHKGHWVTDSGSCLKKWLRFLQKQLQRINKALKNKFKEACLFHLSLVWSLWFTWHTEEMLKFP